MTWKPPPKERVPDFTSVQPFLEYGEPIVKLVPVRLIVGTCVLAERLNPDWTLREGISDAKLEHLLHGWPERAWPPVSEDYLVKGGRGEYHHDYAGIDLKELEGIYFLASGGITRVVAAHLKGFKMLKALVTPARFKPDAPEALKRWVASLKP
jgi:hypothetical protein